MMLSRIAESLFWIGRYLERAEDTSRILDVHLQLLVEDPTVDQEQAARILLAIMGCPAPEIVDRRAVLRLLCHDRQSPSSIVTALAGARESARRARETLSVDLWESINTTWYDVSRDQLAGLRPSSAFRFVRERCATVAGTADSTMTHDEGWHFLNLGRSIERVDMTARLITSAAVNSGRATAWSNALRACGAHHAFVRSYSAATSDADAAEFLLLDPLFPRSVVASLAQAEAALSMIDHSPRRLGYDQADAARLLGRARAELEYLPVSEILDDLVERMTRLQEISSEASTAVAQHYFEGVTPDRWLAERQEQ